MSRKFTRKPHQNDLDRQLVRIMHTGFVCACIMLLLFFFVVNAFAWTPSAAAGNYIQGLVSLPNLIAGAVLALLCVGLVNFVLSNWIRAFKFGLGIVLLLFLFSLAGCSGEQEFSFAMGHKPRQNTLTVTGREGQQLEFVINDDIPAQNLIALQTALSNSLVLDAEAIEKEARQSRQQQTVNVFYAVIWALVFIVGAVCSTAVYVVSRRAEA